MTGALRVVGVSGSTSAVSRTTALVSALLAETAAHVPTEPEMVALADLAPSLAGVLHRGDVPPHLEAAIEAIEGADLLVVATPVYRGAYAGLFKHLFDLVHQDALDGVPVLLAATGGSARHALVIEHQLRPLLSFFRAITLPVGVYAADEDFVGGRIVSPDLQERIQRAVAAGVPLLGTHIISERTLPLRAVAGA